MALEQGADHSGLDHTVSQGISDIPVDSERRAAEKEAMLEAVRVRMRADLAGTPTMHPDVLPAVGKLFPMQEEESEPLPIESVVAAEIRTYITKDNISKETPEMADLRKRILIAKLEARSTEEQRELLKQYGDAGYDVFDQLDLVKSQDQDGFTYQIGRVLLMLSLYCEMRDWDGVEDEMDSAYDMATLLNEPESSKLFEMLKRWENQLRGE